MAQDKIFANLREVKVGERAQTPIVEVTEGKQDQFRTDAYWDAIQEKDSTVTDADIAKQKELHAVLVKTENGATAVYVLPASGILNPKSNLALFKATYGDFPNVGMEVTTKIDQNGFNRLILEK